jgi:hypothetical protein
LLLPGFLEFFGTDDAWRWKDPAILMLLSEDSHLHSGMNIGLNVSLQRTLKTLKQSLIHLQDLNIFLNFWKLFPTRIRFVQINVVSMLKLIFIYRFCIATISANGSSLIRLNQYLIAVA